MSNKILRLPVVIERTGCSRSWIYSMISQGRFPEPISLSIRSVGWLESEIDAWIDQRIKQSRQIQEVNNVA
ncbi:MAG: helix-turn-helix transcriptional regulator [Gammaproteobacteria bacterium]